MYPIERELQAEIRWPSDVAGWVALFDAESMPVLCSSARALEELRGNEDAVDAHLLSETFAGDPLMLLKVLVKVAELRRGREGSDPETLTAALVMLGITPFFRAFAPQLTVDGLLDAHPQARAGFGAVLQRSHRAARFALAFAVQRMDHDAAVLQEAALLHDFAELLIWIRAPALSAEVARRQSSDPALRTADVQREVFGIRLPDLQHALMLKWHLPKLLIDVCDDSRERVSVQARMIVLAIRLARHSAIDWNNPAIADDIKEIAVLLNMGEQPTISLLQDVDGS